MDTLLQDIRYALRTLAKAPGVALVAIVTLGLGVGATTTVFSVVQGVLLRSLPFPHAERLVDIKLTRAEYRHPGMVGGGTSPLAAFFGAVVGVLLCAAGLAAYVPSRRAARLDPVVALRTE